ncbi:amiloride-sensitive sodium channel subunit alpha [Nephila pilipes]|uniref:Amiloride-sensitive sodium channel subunit alpha n=1 Tax=Nephila pilipes TaxID=299642 RepID=A0A8X6QFP3_NEPPI|nr:amiloride-sensitive sodium channel subunit alpha [Nephila pilipes]
MKSKKRMIKTKMYSFQRFKEKRKKKNDRLSEQLKMLFQFLSQGLSAAGVAHVVDAKSPRQRIFWIVTIVIASIATMLMTTRSISVKELEFPAVTVCGRYLISRRNAKEAKLQYMEDLYTFLHSIPIKNVSSRVKSRCYDDPLCSWRRFQEKCECYQSPCDTHHCQLNQDEPLCNCTKHLCDWDATKGLGACQFIRNERDEFCSCRRDFEYPLYNPNVSSMYKELNESFLDNASDKVMQIVHLIRSSNTSDIHDVEYKLLPDVRMLDDYGISYDTLIVSCNYQGNSCDISEDITTLYSPNHGKCYMFNYVGEKDPKIPKKQKMVRHSGRNHGLHLYLQSERKNMLPLFARQVGARIVIHDPRSLPFSKEGGFDIRHGDTTSMSIQYSEINRLGPPWGLCAEDGDSKTSSYTTIPYNQVACEKKCLNKVVFQRCKCYHRIFMSSTTVPSGKRICKTQIDKCFLSVLEDMSRDKIKCNCPAPCREKKYKVIMSSSKLNKKFIRLVKKAKSLKVNDGDLSVAEPEFK